MSFKKTTTITDVGTGEVKEHIETFVTFKNDRDSFQFIKLFLKDLHLLRNLPSGSYKVTFELLFKMNYDNQVIINREIRKEIASICGCKENRVAQIIGELCDKQIMYRHGRGLYYFNPRIFGRGGAKAIQELRMKLTYNKKGRKDEFNEERQGGVL